MKHPLLVAAAVVAAALGAAQFVRPEMTNPPVIPAATFEAVAKPEPKVAAVVRKGCRDCHSNETVWPWYAKIAPMSWMVAHDVNSGRNKLNFSQWNIYSEEMSQIRLKESCIEAKSGRMPVPAYLWLHGDAKLTSEEVNTLCSAVKEK